MAASSPEACAQEDSFRIYLAGEALIGFGFIDFSLIACHFEKANTASGNRLRDRTLVPNTSGTRAKRVGRRLLDARRPRAMELSQQSGRDEGPELSNARKYDRSPRGQAG